MIFIFILAFEILANSILEPLIFTGQIYQAIQKMENVKNESDYIYLYFLERLKWMECGDINNLYFYNSIEIDDENKKNVSEKEYINHKTGENTKKDNRNSRPDETHTQNSTVNSGKQQEDTKKSQSEQYRSDKEDEHSYDELYSSSEAIQDDIDEIRLVPRSSKEMRPIFYLLASEGHTPFFDHIFCHNAFFSFLSTDRNIYGLYLKICYRIVKKYRQNRFFFHDKIDFSNIKKYPQPDYLMHLIRAGDRKAEETLLSMFLRGHVNPRENVRELVYLAEERKNAKAMTVLGTLYLINNDENSSSESSEGENMHESINKKNDTSINKKQGNESQHAAERDTTSAMHYFRSAIAHGDYYAYNGLGRIFMMRNHLEHSLAKGYFQEASLRGSAEGDYNLYLFFKKIYGVDDLHHLLRAVKKSYMPALFTYAQRLYKQGDINQAISHLLPISEYDGPIVILQDQALKDYKNNDLMACFYKLLFLSEMGSLNAINNLIYLLKRGKIVEIPCYFSGINSNRGQNESRINSSGSQSDSNQMNQRSSNQEAHDDQSNENAHMTNQKTKTQYNDIDKIDGYGSENIHSSQNYSQTLKDRILFYLLSKSVHMGQTKHLVSLADCYHYGKGVPRDRSASVSFYYSAYLYNDAKGAYSMYTCYLNGHGTEPSFIKSLFYLLETRRMESNAYLLVWYMFIYTLIIFTIRFNISMIRSICSVAWTLINWFIGLIGLEQKIILTALVGMIVIYLFIRLRGGKQTNE